MLLHSSKYSCPPKLRCVYTSNSYRDTFVRSFILIRVLLKISSEWNHFYGGRKIKIRILTKKKGGKKGGTIDRFNLITSKISQKKKKKLSLRMNHTYRFIIEKTIHNLSSTWKKKKTIKDKWKEKWNIVETEKEGSYRRIKSEENIISLFKIWMMFIRSYCNRWFFDIIEGRIRG